MGYFICQEKIFVRTRSNYRGKPPSDFVNSCGRQIGGGSAIPVWRAFRGAGTRNELLAGVSRFRINYLGAICAVCQIFDTTHKKIVPRQGFDVVLVIRLLFIGFFLIS
jgi:hypothetical protein